VAAIEFYALPMVRWLTLVAVLLEAYRLGLLALRMYGEGADLLAVLHELRAWPFLAGIVLFYTNALFLEDPQAPSDRRGLVLINLLYALYFLSTLLGRYGRMDRRQADRL